MAQRRMFSLKVVDTDLFLEMPATSQLLYFHLAMRADDDGFIGSPNKIRKMVNCSEDDLKLLIAKQYIIPFESGICVIRHWKLHNYIQSDRYNATIYKDEKDMLVNNHGIYIDASTVEAKCIQDVSKEDTQVRLGKVRLGKDRLELLLQEISKITLAKEKQAIVILKAAAANYTDDEIIDAVKEKWGIVNNESYDKPFGALVTALRDNWERDSTNKNSSRKRGKSLKFNNFEAREYDYDSLEKKLLGWDEDDEE